MGKRKCRKRKKRESYRHEMRELQRDMVGIAKIGVTGAVVAHTASVTSGLIKSAK